MTKHSVIICIVFVRRPFFLFRDKSSRNRKWKHGAAMAKTVVRLPPCYRTLRTKPHLLFGGYTLRTKPHLLFGGYELPLK